MTPLTDRLEITLPDGWESQLPSSPPKNDKERMQFVLRLARWNIENETGGPFAAAVFSSNSGELVSIGVNRVVPQCCSLAHAEAVAIALAQQRLKTHDLSTAGHGQYELFASGQPCVQCFGMTWWSGVSRLIIGARASDIEEIAGFAEGPLPSAWQDKLQDRLPLPPVSVTTDVCRRQAIAVLQQYANTDGIIYCPGLS